MSKIVKLYTDSTKSEQMYPETSASVVVTSDGKSLQSVMVNQDLDDTSQGTPTLTNADMLEGHSADYFAVAGDVGGATLLWTNPTSIGSSFSAQTISLDLSDYYAVVVVFSNINNSASRYSCTLCLIGFGASCVCNGNEVNSYIYSRNLSASTSGVTFTNAYNDTNSSTSNTDVYPLYIYGIQ